jgi:predicted aspartyl protease
MGASRLPIIFVLHCCAVAGAPAPVAFDLTPQGAIIVRVSVNGTAAAPFLLDTGANGSAISAALASRIGARVVAKTSVVSAAGQHDAMVVRIEHLAFGGVTADGVLATLATKEALDLPDLAARGAHVDGVIGQDVLAAHRYTIDYRKRKIIWHRSIEELPPDAAVFELERSDDRFVAVMPQNGQTLRLVPDSGAEALVLFQPREQPRRDVRLVAGAAPRLMGIAGSRFARSAVLRTLRVGSALFTDVPAVIVEPEHGSGSLDGLLPLHRFARVTFNGPDRQLLIEAR